jgi:hypothetical protein
MAETAPNGGVRANTSAGHISVHVEGDHPVEVPFLFEQQEKRLGPAFVASFVYHLAMFGILLLVIRYGSRTSTTAAVLPEQPNANIIWRSCRARTSSRCRSPSRLRWKSSSR